VTQTISGGVASNSTSDLKRRDIQGLRAVAVLGVIAFHAGLPVPGGFTGVDVFFVISGFVITQVLLRELDTGTDGILLRFYTRRVRRLLPALALLVSVTLLLTPLILSPLGAQQVTALTGVGAMLLVGNIVIAEQTGDYFALAAETNPLLNVWSLSVEEQFYLFFPALLLFILLRAHKRPRVLLSAALMVIGGLSFALAVAGSRGYGYLLGEFAWLLGFYSPVVRIWEFILGVLVALGAQRVCQLPRKVLSVLGLVGIGMVLLSYLVISDQTPFPGPMTMLPTVGALFIVAAGMGSQNTTTRILSIPPLVRVGDWSYSLYLWHWPFIVFSIALWPMAPLAPLIAAFISFGPALVSYQFVETPFRYRQVRIVRHEKKLLAFLLIVPVILGVALWFWAERVQRPAIEAGAVQENHPNEVGLALLGDKLTAYTNACEFEMPRIDGAQIDQDRVTWCRQSKANQPINVAVIGDSHGLHLYPALAEFLPQRNVAWFDSQGVPDSSNPFAEEISSYIAADPTIESVVVSAKWGLRGVDETELDSFITSLTDAGKRVIIADDIPEFPFDPFVCAYRVSILANSLCEIPRSLWDEQFEPYRESLDSIAARNPDASVVNTHEAICSDDTCSMVHRGGVIYGDPNHLNWRGSQHVVRHILEETGLA
jgi:peptidoglycan/LPS O-acetylase OafA/YrhL